MKWQVQRDSGRAGSGWRVLYEGDEATARRKFDAEQKKLRQGGLSLIRPDGRTEFIVHAPRLRTKW